MAAKRTKDSFGSERYTILEGLNYEVALIRTENMKTKQKIWKQNSKYVVRLKLNLKKKLSFIIINKPNGILEHPIDVYNTHSYIDPGINWWLSDYFRKLLRPTIHSLPTCPTLVTLCTTNLSKFPLFNITSLEERNFTQMHLS